ncbi:MAG: 2,3-bisphosphoglycerate-independent phosphoglycerate mutase, partial [Bacteroidia bacterium]|nr:2,3-bisphosphoglycerate-independent phosphoglycerate mutase [Bacteroidia bacterium]
MLLILDGWGIGKIPDADAIRQADTPIMDKLIENYPSSTLVTYGGNVGLPEGQMGNSEVGHLNIGAGRVVFQELARINNAIADNSIAEIAHLTEAIELAKSKKKPIHLMGLLSDGGVHSHIDHLLGLLDILDRAEVPEVYIHCFLDGRDTSPTGGIAYVSQLLNHLKRTRGNIATIIGRYYAMDRDKRWERTRLAFDLLVKSEAKFYTTDPEKV